jgi:hypothetical protein
MGRRPGRSKEVWQRWNNVSCNTQVPGSNSRTLSVWLSLSQTSKMICISYYLLSFLFSKTGEGHFGQWFCMGRNEPNCLNITAEKELWAHGWSSASRTASLARWGLLPGRTESSIPNRVDHSISTGWLISEWNLKTVKSQQCQIPKFSHSSEEPSTLFPSPTLWWMCRTTLGFKAFYPWETGASRESGNFLDPQTAKLFRPAMALGSQRSEATKEKAALKWTTDPWLPWPSIYLQYQELPETPPTFLFSE